VLTYLPSATFGGVDVVSYTVSDGAGGATVGTATIHVLNEAPVAHDDVTATAPNALLFYPVLLNDTDANLDELMLISIEQPANGVAVISGQMVVYTSTSDFEGTAVIPYTISDGKGGNASATLHVEVSPFANALPIAQPDTPAIGRDAPSQIDVLANDFDPNQEALTIVAVGMPQFGTAVIDQNQIRYTPQRSFVGVDRFTYVVEDQQGGRAETAVEVSVALENTIIFDVDPHATQIQTITTPDHRLTLTIPVGALPETVRQIAYTPVENSFLQPALTHGVGSIFALNVGDGSQIFTHSPIFARPLALTIHYDPNAMPHTMAEDNLQLFFYNETAAIWETAGVVVRDHVNHTVTATVTHFTDFTLGTSYTLYLPIIGQGD
jgi:hypothetical protein